MNSYHTLCRPFFFSYMRYSVRQASSDSLLVVSSSAIACRCRLDGHYAKNAVPNIVLGMSK